MRRSSGIDPANPARSAGRVAEVPRARSRSSAALRSDLNLPCGRRTLRGRAPPGSTGVHIELEGLTGVYKNLVRGIVALVFRCRALNDPVDSTAEVREIRSLEPPEISECMDEAYAVRLLDAIEHGPVRVRAHD
jgi:hypothetical protein